jgi:hypothetical protein
MIGDNRDTAKAFASTFAFFANAQTNAKKIQKSHQANAPQHDKKNNEHLTAPTQKSGFRVPKTVLW